MCNYIYNELDELDNFDVLHETSFWEGLYFVTINAWKVNDAQGMDINTWTGDLRNVQNEWGCQDVCKRKGIQVYKCIHHQGGCNYIICVT